MSHQDDRSTDLTDAEADAILDSAGEFKLDRNSRGEIRANLNNAISLIEHSPDLKGTIWFDEFLQRIMTSEPPREWKDTDDLRLALYIQRNAGVPSMNPEVVVKAVHAVADRATKNCVKDWLNSLIWDGVPRIKHFFADHFGAKATEYVLAASLNFWISMCARVYRPGCQVDNMIVLEGSQGIGKSKAMRAIGGQFYAEQHESASNPKAFSEILQGKWLIEISEMDSFNRSEVTRVKQIISCTSDRYRVAYGRHAADYPRQGVFVGTTNRDDWNKDETGARRFWPIACSGVVDIPAILAARTQLFAEAAHRFNCGQSWWEMPEIETLEEQKSRYDGDVWVDSIEIYIRAKTYVTANEILMDHLRFQEKDCTKKEQMRVTTCLRSLGWGKRTIRTGETIIKAWLPPQGGNRK